MQRSNQRHSGGQQRGQMSGGQEPRGRQYPESLRNLRGNQSQTGRQGFRGEMPFYGQHFDDDQNEQWNRGQLRYPETRGGEYRPNRAQDDRYHRMNAQQGNYSPGPQGMYEQGGLNAEGDESFGDTAFGRYGTQNHELPPYEDHRYQMNGRYSQNQGAERQNFFGRGPKGYKRSDERIKEDVSDRIAQLGHIDATDVEVTVNGGEVTLMGSIPDRSMKYELEHLALGVVGVSDVSNQLRLKREETGSTNRAGKSNEDRKNLGSSKM
ncbi:MAG: BON domain-containing protein [Myxococcaceae bacterium]|nr:BON domain-containing protein [Myxococcaceae bacterium]